MMFKNMEEKINHPFYCVWCGDVLEDKPRFEIHYKECSEPAFNDEDFKEFLFDLEHNPEYK